MGGAIGEGNVTPAAEFNIWADPEAAHRVFSSGLDVTMVGLDVTHKALMRPRTSSASPPAGRPGRLRRRPLRLLRRASIASRYGWDGAPVHDAVALAHVIDPTLLEPSTAACSRRHRAPSSRAGARTSTAGARRLAAELPRRGRHRRRALPRAARRADRRAVADAVVLRVLPGSALGAPSRCAESVAMSTITAPSTDVAPASRPRRAGGTLSDRLIRRPDPRWVRPALIALLVLTAARLPLGPRAPPATPTASTPPPCRPATQELEGVLLRLARLLELHHRRQAARLAVGDGAVGADLRLQQLEHARAAGARGRRRGRPAVRARSGAGSAPAAGLAAGAMLALTPVAALMFRFNNPDALLVLLLVGARLLPDPRARDAAARAGSSRPAR